MLCSQSPLDITIENECVDADLLRYRVELPSIMEHAYNNDIASNNTLKSHNHDNKCHVMKIYYQTLQTTASFGEDQLVQDCDQVLGQLNMLLCLTTQQYMKLVPINMRKQI